MKIASITLYLFTVLILATNSCKKSPSSMHPEDDSGASYVILQEGNYLPQSQLVAKPSGELEDNHIGAIVSQFTYGGYFEIIVEEGFKRLEFTYQEVETPVDYSQDEFFIPPLFDTNFNNLVVQNGITSAYILNFWDKANHPQRWQGISSRFTTEEEILRYLDYVRFIVRHFKDRIQYYKIWNEPDGGGDPAQYVMPAEMINLIRRTVPVIHEEYPQAKVVVGTNVVFFSQDYLFELLNSDIMPLVDVIDWQSMGDEVWSGEWDLWRAFYSNYPSFVQQIKQTASAHGFSGEYWASELWWWFPGHPSISTLLYPESAIMEVKNRTRGFVNQLGLDITIRATGSGFEPIIVSPALTSFFTVMAGAVADSLTAGIEGAAADIADIKQYGFTFQNDEQGVILWQDVEPQPLANIPGVPVTVTLSGFAGRQAIGIDVLHHFWQQLVTNDVGEDLVIQGLLVKDYPIIIQISSASSQ
jgi:hypothetical protein